MISYLKFILVPKLETDLINQIKFWEQFNVHKPENQKVLGLYEVQSINGPCLVTLATNSKEYLEYFKSESINKKHKGIKKSAVGMDYENFAEKIKPLFILILMSNQKPIQNLLLEFQSKKER